MTTFNDLVTEVHFINGLFSFLPSVPRDGDCIHSPETMDAWGRFESRLIERYRTASIYPSYDLPSWDLSGAPFVVEPQTHGEWLIVSMQHPLMEALPTYEKDHGGIYVDLPKEILDSFPGRARKVDRILFTYAEVLDPKYWEDFRVYYKPFGIQIKGVKFSLTLITDDGRAWRNPDNWERI